MTVGIKIHPNANNTFRLLGEGTNIWIWRTRVGLERGFCNRVQGSGFTVEGSRFRVLRTRGLGFRGLNPDTLGLDLALIKGFRAGYQSLRIY